MNVCIYACVYVYVCPNNTHTLVPPSAAVAIGTIRAATAAAEPPLDPPLVIHGFKKNISQNSTAIPCANSNPNVIKYKRKAGRMHACSYFIECG